METGPPPMLKLKHCLSHVSCWTTWLASLLTTLVCSPPSTAHAFANHLEFVFLREVWLSGPLRAQACVKNRGQESDLKRARGEEGARRSWKE